MTTRNRLARGEEAVLFSGRVRKWERRWVPEDEGDAKQALRLMRWVQTGEPQWSPAAVQGSPHRQDPIAPAPHPRRGTHSAAGHAAAPAPAAGRARQQLSTALPNCGRACAPLRRLAALAGGERRSRCGTSGPGMRPCRTGGPSASPSCAALPSLARPLHPQAAAPSTTTNPKITFRLKVTPTKQQAGDAGLPGAAQQLDQVPAAGTAASPRSAPMAVD